jgi:hypothetical protein
MLQGGLKESSQKTINIYDIRPSVFKAILEFIYTDTVTITEEIAVELLIASDRFLLKKLMTMCENVLLRGTIVSLLTYIFNIISLEMFFSTFQEFLQKTSTLFLSYPHNIMQIDFVKLVKILSNFNSTIHQIQKENLLTKFTQVRNVICNFYTFRIEGFNKTHKILKICRVNKRFTVSVYCDLSDEKRNSVCSWKTICGSFFHLTEELSKWQQSMLMKKRPMRRHLCWSEPKNRVLFWKGLNRLLLEILSLTQRTEKIWLSSKQRLSLILLLISNTLTLKFLNLFFCYEKKYNTFLFTFSDPFSEYVSKYTKYLMASQDGGTPSRNLKFITSCFVLLLILHKKQ